MADWAARVRSQVQGEAAKYDLSFCNNFTFRDYLNTSFGLRAMSVMSVIFYEEHSRHKQERGESSTHKVCLSAVFGLNSCQRGYSVHLLSTVSFPCRR